ncbi:streptomycin adenylyltransferase, putative [Cordyceps militaris CM01]|uniref:Streptomycin adenylyltransferase, putative n=1 Tax=Cordyceps militaris (strain CM01) TaxID=983644 RepID=G3J6P8_CORMM|nr:streptomycin adenylyltransferase, putative [Cordyceps militaris CM01]EGX95376.1 streptomycin adenylyltransferase, putative [Cordyceps militaris CM01]
MACSAIVIGDCCAMVEKANIEAVHSCLSAFSLEFVGQQVRYYWRGVAWAFQAPLHQGTSALLQLHVIMDAASEEYLHNLSDRISRALEGNLTAIYLHGSAVLRGYNRRWSDLEVLVVVPSQTTLAQRAAVAETVSEKALPCPATGLEISIVTESATANPDTAAPAFELHMTTAASNSKIVEGRGHDGGPDLLIHFAVCRAKGRILANFAAPKMRVDVFGAVPRKRIIAQLQDELRRATSEGPQHYAVLNASRAWMYAGTRQLVSKAKGGQWAMSRLQRDERIPDQGNKMTLIERALARQTGDEAVIMVADDVKRYVDFVLQALELAGDAEANRQRR